MSSAHLGMASILLTQTGAGILGNSALLCLYNFVLFTRHQVRSTDLILNQLVLANSTVLFSRGIMQTMAAFGWKYFLDDAGCKVVFYLHRVGRGVSLSTTCLLSVFQATKLCSSYSQLHITTRSPKSICFCCSLLWILHLLLNTIVPLKMTQSLNSKNMSVMRQNFGYCSAHILSSFLSRLHGVMFLSFDTLNLSLMVWASGSMALVLHRHKRRVQHLHSSCLSPRPRREARATRTILTLVSSFILFYSLSSILTFCFSFVNPGQWLVPTSVLVSSSFPTFSSFVLLATDSRISQFCSPCWERKMLNFC